MELMAERVENFHVELSVAGDKVPGDLAERAHRYFEFAKSVKPGDMWNITYDFNVLYFGMIAERFSMLLELMELGTVAKVRTEELKLGKSLAQELLVRMEQIEQRFGRASD